MRFHHRFVLVVIAVVLLAGACSRSSEKKATLAIKEDSLAAEVEDWQLTTAQLQSVIDRLPEQQRHKYETPQGRANLAQLLMQDEMAYREAMKMKMEDEPDVSKQIHDATRAILVGAYLRQQVDPKASPSDAEMHDYYESHKDEFTMLEKIRAQHILSKQEAHLIDLRKRIEEGGEKFTTLATLYSEDGITAPEGGDVGYFNPGGYIRGVGYSQTFTDAVLQMEIGKVYGPIKWEQGYSLVRVNEREPAHLRPYDEVRDEISKRMAYERVDQTRQEHFAVVEKGYETRNLMRERYESVQRGPEELFQFAQEAEDPRVRIETFEEIVKKYPEDSHVPEAIFMMGFVYAEELRDIVAARRAFYEVVQRFPDTEMAKSAQWMMDNLDKPLPKFEDIDDLNSHIEKEKQSN